MGLVCVQSVQALTATSSPASSAPVSPLKVSAYSMSLTTNPSGGYDEIVQYVELYNSSSSAVNPAEYELRITDTQGSMLAATAIRDDKHTGFIAPGQFLVVSFNGFVNNAQFNFAAPSTHYAAKPALDREIQLLRGGTGVYAKAIKQKIDSSQPQTRLTFLTVTAEEQANETMAVYDSPLYVPRTSFELAPTEILANPKTCAPTDDDNACKEYVEFYNSTPHTIDFAGVRLRVGYLGQSSSASNTTVLSGTVASGAYAIFPIGITNTGGYIWLEDQYGIMPFDDTVVEYPDASSTTHKGQSWALVDGAWQWATPTPQSTNIALPAEAPAPTASSALTPCRDDQYRNPLTNRCNLISTSASSLTPCAADQYRSPETNRCRSLGSGSSSSLTPCRDDQYRNPETNRCKSLAATTSALTPCQDGWERNPETNRCRKAQSSGVPKADFAVQPTGASSVQTLPSLVAFAGVGSVAVGYGAWEWRREVMNAVGKLRSLMGR